MSTKPAKLMSSLMSIKGQASPAQLIEADVPESVPELVELPKPVIAAKPRTKPVKPPEHAPAPVVETPIPEGGQSYWKAMTLKLDRARFIKLKKLGVDQNKTSQTILIEALDLWLAKYP